MGKKDVEKNIPANHSLSWTLDHLCTEVQLELSSAQQDEWQPLDSEFPFEMSVKGKEKYLNHAQRVKSECGLTQSFIIRSANYFPADCGIASSASSFAALTEAICVASKDLGGKDLGVQEKSLLSARGSGSSCRSFMPGFVEWQESSLNIFESPFKNLVHMVVLVGAGAKKVSSSDAHKKVSTSLLYEGRIDRANNRLEQLKKSLLDKNWKQAFEITWAEFWDMHALFETSEPAFGYYLPDSFAVLNKARRFWEENNDGPLVTMDAGPNVHLLWREEQKDQAQKFYTQEIQSQWQCLHNFEGESLV